MQWICLMSDCSDRGMVHESQVAAGGVAMDGEAAPAGVEQLLAHFLTGALGLALEAAVPPKSLPVRRPAQAPSGDIDPLVWAAWKTDRGEVTICGAYDGPQSRRSSAHMLYLAWWM